MLIYFRLQAHSGLITVLEPERPPCSIRAKERYFKVQAGTPVLRTVYAFLHNYEISKSDWPRRQNLSVANYCGIARIRMDPLAILRRGFLGNRVGNPVCAALSATVAVHGAEAHTCCARYSNDRRDDGDSAGDADLRVVAAGRIERVREDPVGRAEYRPVFSAGLWRSTRVGG